MEHSPLQVQIFHNPWERPVVIVSQAKLKHALERLVRDITKIHERLSEQGLAELDDHVAVCLLHPTLDTSSDDRLAIITTDGCHEKLIEEAHLEARLHRRFGEPRTSLDYIQLHAAAHALTNSASAACIGINVGVASPWRQQDNSHLAQYVARHGYRYIRKEIETYCK